MSQVVVVTGGAGGIGSAICRGLAHDGLKVVVADCAEQAGNALVEEIRRKGGEVIFQKVDVGDKASAVQMVQAALARYDQIDFLINGAAVMPRSLVQDMEAEEWDRVLRINLKGTFLCSQAVLYHMRERGGGRIICVTSGRGVVGHMRAAHYAASKGGVIAFVKSLAMEVAPYNVVVNAIAPGITDTPMSRAGSKEEEWKKLEAVPRLMGGLTDKEEIVGLIRYLQSESARYITGQTFFLRTPK